MRICFQTDPRFCPDLQIEHQRVRTTVPAAANSDWVELTVEVQSWNPEQFARQLQRVPAGFERFRQAQSYESEIPGLTDMAAEISRRTLDPVEWTLAAMTLVQQRMAYDPNLALAYDQGRKTGLSLSEAWIKGKGTCREFAMAMAALCQAQGIPVRFVQGISACGQLHCFNEIDLYPLGWLPVDVQAGMLGQWGNLAVLRIAEKIEDLPMPCEVKIRGIEPLVMQSDRQVYLKLKKLPDEVKGSGQFLLRQWAGKAGVRCFLHLTSELEQNEKLQGLSDRVFSIVSVFSRENHWMKVGEAFNAAVLPRMEILCRQLKNNDIRARLAAGINCDSQTAAVWVEIAVSETLWAKLDPAKKTLDFKPEWIRLVQARSVASLLAKLKATLGS